jgi:hypothetical protein
MPIRTLLIINTKTQEVVHRRTYSWGDTAFHSCITKPLYQMLADGSHIAWYENEKETGKPRIPIRDPVSGRYFVKPHSWNRVLRKGRKDEVVFPVEVK